MKFHLMPWVPSGAGRFLLEVLKQRVSAGAVDFDLAKHGEGDPVVELTEFLNFVVGAGVLIAELVAGKTEYLQPLCLVLLVGFFQPAELWV